MEVERRKAIIVCCVVGFLGLLSAATGFAAEAKRIKATDLWYEDMTNGSILFKYFSSNEQVRSPSPGECVNHRSPAFGLGLTAAVALMIAQIIINVATRCVCCTKGPHQSNSNWTTALICFLVSWFTFVIAFFLLLTGAALNDEQHGDENLYFGNYYCYVVKRGVFAGASVLSLASVILGMIYYLTLNSAKNSNNAWGADIAMGQPQFPPQDPLFVHEDTYMRRQFT